MNTIPSPPPADESARYRRSREHMERARRVLTRGVGSAMREAQRPTPLAIASAGGGTLIDEDGNRYIDHVLGLGPILLGHRAPEVERAVSEQLDRGVLFGAQHRGEAELAERIVELVPSAELVALSNTGSEAVHAALRFARAATGRELIVKFEGHYHGWIDPVYASGPAGPTLAESGGPAHTVPGLAASPELLACRWNDLDALSELLGAHSGRVAAVIMEPLPCNFGNYEPLPGYLEGVRGLCDEHEAVLIFDEVITGFRLGLGGAQERYGVQPDLTVLAKAIASGFPLSAVAGSRRIMSVAEASGPVRHIGTYNGSAISVAAANATLESLARGGEELYARLDSLGSRLAAGLREVAAACGAPLLVNQVGSVLHLLWGPRTPVRTYEDASHSDRAAVADIAAGLLGSGIMALERGLWFVCAAHTPAEIEATIAAAEEPVAAALATTERQRPGALSR